MQGDTDPGGEDPYSRQLRAGFRWLRFEGELERRYRDRVMDGQRGPAQVCAVIGLLAWSVFSVIEFGRAATLGEWHAVTWQGWTGIGVSYAFTLFAIASVRLTRRRYDWLAWTGYLIFSLAVVAMVFVGRMQGTFAGDGPLAIVVMAAFLPLGFTFHRALAGAGIVALLAIVLLWSEAQTSTRDRLHTTLMVLLSLPVAAIGDYLREHSERAGFLLVAVLDRQAAQDPLTGLANRRQLARQAGAALARAERGGHPLTVAMVDLDHFKQYNDLYGHPAGDRVLARLGRALARVARAPPDQVARIGGEEFCLVLHGLDAIQARARLDRVLADLAARRIGHTGSPFGRVTFSAGVAQRAPAEDFPALLARADAALYAAKHDGRNRIRLA